MNLSQNVTRAAAVLTATAAATAAFAAPALGNAGLNLSTQIDSAAPSRQVVSAVQLVQGTRNLDLRTRNVTAACEGVSVGDATTTRLTECALFVNGIRSTNVPRALPGPGVVSATVSQLVPIGSSVYACATASAVWSDSTISANRRTCTASQIALA